MGCAVGADGNEFCQACVAGTFANSDGRCVAIPGQTISHDFPTQTIAAGGQETIR